MHARHDPQSFVDDLIVERLGTRHLVVGDDFRYGSNAGGTIESLRAAGRAHGFGVEQVGRRSFSTESV